MKETLRKFMLLSHIHILIKLWRKIFPFGLSDTETRASVTCFCPTNLGGTNFSKNENGDFELKTLDSLKIKEKIDLIKIDVEGSELEVLNGAINTIKKSLPIIIVETFNEKAQVEDLLFPLGYKLYDSHANMCDYIYFNVASLKNTNNADYEIVIANNSKFYLPKKPTDCIQLSISHCKNYWDMRAHHIIDKYLKDNAIILDIGANIGSHSLYWANERNAKKVYAFEPLPEALNFLENHVKINGLEKKIEVFPFGLSDEITKGKIAHYSKRNIGSTSFKKTDDGDFELKPLDSINIKDKIDLIKIDAEGAEMDVLNGAIETIKKNKPIIVIETFKYKEQVDEFLFKLGYEHIDTIREEEDFIYKHREN